MNTPVVGPRGASQRKRSLLALILIATAQFTATMDSSIVGVALPHIQSSLHFSEASLSWVFNGYVLAFGGLLLVGGRLSDLLGARRLFVIGWVVLGAGSALAAAAVDPVMLIVARAVQGGGSALLAPSALSLLMAVFGGTDRLQRAFTVYGAMAPIGGTAGVFAGGLLTQALDWRWVFWVTLPLAAAAIVLTPFCLPASPRRQGSLALGSAALASGGISLLVAGLVLAPDVGWGSPMTVSLLVGGIVLLAAFLVAQRLARDPLLQLSLFRVPLLAGANVAQFVLGAAWIPTWFFLNLYLQDGLGLDAIVAGAAMAPMIIVTALTMTLLVPRLVKRLSPRVIVSVGFVLLGASMAWFALTAAASLGYWAGVLPPSLLASFGMALVFIPTLTNAVANAPEDQSGVASALVNTSYQIGSAVGLAAITAIVAAVAASDGRFVAVFAAAGGICVLGLMAALATGRVRRGVDA